MLVNDDEKQQFTKPCAISNEGASPSNKKFLLGLAPSYLAFPLTHHRSPVLSAPLSLKKNNDCSQFRLSPSNTPPSIQ